MLHFSVTGVLKAAALIPANTVYSDDFLGLSESVYELDTIQLVDELQFKFPAKSVFHDYKNVSALFEELGMSEAAISSLEQSKIDLPRVSEIDIG